MADPQIKNGYTRIANELLEAICRLNISGNEMRILLYVIRRTFGFQRDCAEIPNSEIARATGINRNHVCESLKKLRLRGMISQQTSVSRTQILSVVSDYEIWNSSQNQEQSKTGTVPENRNTDAPEIRNDDAPENGNDTVSEIRNDTYIKKEKENLKESIKESKQGYGRGENVLLSESEYNDLVKDYGKETAERYIERMDNYILARNVTYRNCYAELMLWLDKDNVKKRDPDAIDISEYEWVINRF